MRFGVILAGLAILWIAKPAFPASPALETFQGPKGSYYRIPPGYLWENGAYNFSILVPEGAEVCTDDWFTSSHGPVLGPGNEPCLEVFKHPSVTIYAGYTIAYSDPVDKQTLIRRNCETHRVRTTDIVVDGQSFLKCWGRMDYHDDKSRYMDYFTFSEPNPGIALHVSVFCPSTGNCNKWIAKWETLIFDNLHIHWRRDDASASTGGAGKDQTK